MEIMNGIPEIIQENIERKTVLDVLNKLGLKSFPYKSVLSFEKLLEKIQEKSEAEDFGERFFATHVMELMHHTPSLTKPIEDLSKLKHFKEVLEVLMLAVIPPFLRDKQAIKISPPLNLISIYETTAFRDLAKQFELKYIFDRAPEAAAQLMILSACSLILNRFYGQEIHIDPPIILSIKNKKTGITRYLKTQLNTEFLDIKLLKPLKPLTEMEIQKMLSDYSKIEFWIENIPPENFEFQGFTIGTLVDITNEEALSRINHRLLEKDAIIEQENVLQLEQLVQQYLKLPKTRLGIFAFNYPINAKNCHRYNIRFHLLANRPNNLVEKFLDTSSVYEKALKNRSVEIIGDIEKLPRQGEIEKNLLKEGIKSIVVAPLLSKRNQIIGILELGYPEPFGFNSLMELEFHSLIRLFAIAVERSRDETDNRVEAIMREQFTAIHPSVEWKFFETSFRLLEKREQYPNNGEVDPIIFHDVYPLYGQSDIVGSSSKRNQVILDDLIENLQLVLELLEICSNTLGIPLASHYLLKAEKHIQHLKKEFNSNDESVIIEFLHQEIHPLLRSICLKYEALAPPIQAYFEKMDPDLQIIYHLRKKYEDSVTIINNRISNFLKNEEIYTQKILPHYFEKYKTDGVEYDIYVGQALLNQETYNPLHLKNLKLWQLISMCEITRMIDRLKPELPMVLSTAQLIFVYGSPLSIRFRMDEKQFDVDGAYNVRYEILKKRVDKALIEDTQERLTQAGMVAIVYLQEKDRLEYLEYLEFLQSKGYIDGTIEDLKIGKLQGVQGLNALRFKVSPGER